MSSTNSSKTCEPMERRIACWSVSKRSSVLLVPLRPGSDRMQTRARSVVPAVHPTIPVDRTRAARDTTLPVQDLAGTERSHSRKAPSDVSLERLAHLRVERIDGSRLTLLLFTRHSHVVCNAAQHLPSEVEEPIMD